MKTSISLSLLSLTILSVTACSSGSNGSPASSNMEKNNISSNTSTLNNSPNNNSATSSQASSAPQSGTLDKLGENIKVEKKTSTATISIDEKPVKNHKFIILGKDYGHNDIELDLFPRYKLSQENWEESFNIENEHWNEKGFWRVYNQQYSAIVGNLETVASLRDQNRNIITETKVFEIEDVVGYNTKENELPKLGSVKYNGIAFDKDQQGNLVYHVDFDKKQGYGEITGIDNVGKINLEKGDITTTTENKHKYITEYFKENQLGIFGTAKAEKATDDKTVKSYHLQFFGPNAEEISGTVFTLKEDWKAEDAEASIGFAGTK
ncbi:factor H binding protein domain-containing protein [Ursidibacter arcticus]